MLARVTVSSDIRSAEVNSLPRCCLTPSAGHHREVTVIASLRVGVLKRLSLLLAQAPERGQSLVINAFVLADILSLPPSAFP